MCKRIFLHHESLDYDNSLVKMYVFGCLKANRPAFLLLPIIGQVNAS